ncbi:MAG: hypothetical protein A3D95_15925 [Betaproteobacteria bacterium RIFCSPHIGHO2_12_FULL_69_13]|nr:MAG: hypothetical protein A3D95_15925 [Betaproteobacteria bacterium RIFCSPHIGHO2_12_FULL_69_13]OGA69313.1 MAG: hypothetical protein A3G83_02580 [Betaproteobacteria bacterium RIFCSPLOWO2_12_FULL_68_20]
MQAGTRNRGIVLTKAAARSAHLLGLSRATFSLALGISEKRATRVLTGLQPIDPARKEGELAVLLVRVYRALDVLVGGDEAQRRAWIRGYNRVLNGRPMNLIERVQGLVGVLSYLEGVRAVELDRAGRSSGCC